LSSRGANKKKRERKKEEEKMSIRKKENICMRKEKKYKYVCAKIR
jgi:hypothetical protein